MSPFETLHHPQMLHAIVVHFPVALAILGIPLVYLCIVTEQARPTLLRVALACYILLTLSALVAMEFGERAMAQVPGSVGSAALQTLAHHEEMAEKLWMIGAGTAVLLALSFIRHHWVRNTALALALITSIAGGLWVTLVGHYGGTLVYKYGVGTPAMMALEPALPATPWESAAQPAPTPVSPEATPAASENLSPAPPVESVIPPRPAEAPAPSPPAGAVESAPSQPEAAPSPPAEAPESASPSEEQPDKPAGDQEALTPAHPIDPELAAQVSYTKDVKPIIERRCVVCHNPSNASGEQDLTTVAAMLKPGEEAGAAVVPGRPGQSAMVRYIRGELKPQMPKGGPPLSEGELHIIREWIAAGANDDTPALDVKPSEKPAEAPVPPESTGAESPA